MTRESINGRRLVGLFLLGVLLFNFPLLSLFNRPALVWGIPVVFLYLFSVWALFIFMILLISRSNPKTTFPDQTK